MATAEAGDDIPAGPARQRILATALRLFEERGFERTTMRAVAGEAGVSLGSAYYYFASKEHLVQGFYDRMQAAHSEAVTGVLEGTKDAVERLVGVHLAWIDVSEPYHQFAASFFRVAAEPTSPLSPFSEESSPARDAAVDIWRRALAGSDLTVDKALAERLPHLLWLAQMGLVLFWVHDRSPGQARSRDLVRVAVPLLVRALRLTRLLPVRGFVREVVAALDALGVPGARAEHRGAGAAGR